MTDEEIEIIERRVLDLVSKLDSPSQAVESMSVLLVSIFLTFYQPDCKEDFLDYISVMYDDIEEAKNIKGL